MPDYFDEWARVIYNVCRQSVMVSNGMSMNYLYESAKDVLKWNNVSVKDNIRHVMHIGTLVGLDDESFKKSMSKRNAWSGISGMTLEDLNNIYKD